MAECNEALNAVELERECASLLNLSFSLLSISSSLASLTASVNATSFSCFRRRISRWLPLSSSLRSVTLSSRRRIRSLAALRASFRALGL